MIAHRVKHEAEMQSKDIAPSHKVCFSEVSMKAAKASDLQNDASQRTMVTMPWLLVYFLLQAVTTKRHLKHKGPAFKTLCIVANLQTGIDNRCSFAADHGENHVDGIAVHCSTRLWQIIGQFVQDVWQANTANLCAGHMSPERSLPAFMWCIASLAQDNTRGRQVRHIAAEICSKLIAYVTVCADAWASSRPQSSVQLMVASKPKGWRLNWMIHAHMNKSRHPQLSAHEQDAAKQVQISRADNILRGNLMYWNQTKKLLLDSISTGQVVICQ